MPKLSGNKGEWSEVYVLLYLLATGKLYAADGNLQKNLESYYEILEILRNEKNGKVTFCLSKDSPDVKIIKNNGQTVEYKISGGKFKEWSEYLLKKIIDAKVSTFTVDEIENFLTDIQVETLKAQKTDKSDIVIRLHDILTGLNLVQGFSVKSKLGAPATLINPSGATNFIYQVQGNISDDVMGAFNSLHNFKDKSKLLSERNCRLRFHSLTNKIFECNLSLIDSCLPEICANALTKYYMNGIASVKEALCSVAADNPINYDLANQQPFYQYKFKRLLSECAIGMIPSEAWHGHSDANGGCIIVKENGEVLCYHLFNYNAFEQYLFENTKFDTPSTTRYGFGSIYKDGDSYFCKLNLQIRFIK